MSISNNPPDVELRLTHEQATFMLENCRANRELCLKIIMSIADDEGSVEEKRERADGVVDMNEKFGEIQRLLHAAGAKEKEN